MSEGARRFLRFLKEKWAMNSTRLVFLVVLVVVPLNLLNLALTSVTVRDTRTNYLLETKENLSVYMTLADNALDTAAYYFHYFTRDNIDFRYLNTKPITDEEEYYNQLQMMVRLRIELENLLYNNRWISGAFAFFPQKDGFNIVADQTDSFSRYKIALTEHILRCMEDAASAGAAFVGADTTTGAETALAGERVEVGAAGTTVSVGTAFGGEGATTDAETALAASADANPRSATLAPAPAARIGPESRWHVARIGGEPFLLLYTRYRNSCYGLWVEVNALAASMQLVAGAGSRELVFTADGGEVCWTTPRLAERTSSGLSKGANAETALVAGEDMAPSGATAATPLFVEPRFSGFGKTLRAAGGTWYPVSIPSGYVDGFALTALVPTGTMTKALPAFITVFQVLTVITLLVVPFLLYFSRQWVIRPVEDIVRGMEEVRSGDITARVPDIPNSGEFTRIAEQFNRTMDEMVQLKIEGYERNFLNQEVKMRFLSQQIQPHFILNALNILYSYEKDEFPLIQKMILCLSDYFRYIVNARLDFVPLETEMRHLENYFEIQTARYPESFVAEVRCPPECARLLVPPLLLETYAENAIKHGMRVGEPISIAVTAAIVGGAECAGTALAAPAETSDAAAPAPSTARLELTVRDTGKGMRPEVLEAVRELHATGKKSDLLGVGLLNNVERLRLLYGKDAAVRVESSSALVAGAPQSGDASCLKSRFPESGVGATPTNAAPTGTTITIQVPLRYEAEDDVAGFIG